MKHRIFIGIPLPASQSPLISQAQSSLGGLKVQLQWEPLEKIHLTLNFLGHIEEAILHTILSQIPAATNHFGSLSLKLTFLETLYQRHDYSLVYLSPTGDTDRLKELRRNINQELAHFKLAQPERFLPHFTIAKLAKSDPLTTKTWLDQISILDFPPGENFTIDSIVVYESLLSKAGSTYRRIASFSLI